MKCRTKRVLITLGIILVIVSNILQLGLSFSVVCYSYFPDSAYSRKILRVVNPICTKIELSFRKAISPSYVSFTEAAETEGKTLEGIIGDIAVLSDDYQVYIAVKNSLGKVKVIDVMSYCWLYKGITTSGIVIRHIHGRWYLYASCSVATEAIDYEDMIKIEIPDKPTEYFYLLPKDVHSVTYCIGGETVSLFYHDRQWTLGGEDGPRCLR